MPCVVKCLAYIEKNYTQLFIIIKCSRDFGYKDTKVDSQLSPPLGNQIEKE